jgi:CarD family transcriptional regulator
MFYVGDKVVYPLHGAGEIIAIEKREVLGETKYFYVIKMLIEQMKILIPANTAQKIGLRKVITEEEMNKVLQILDKGEKEDMDISDWRQRYMKNLNKLKSGCIYNAAKVLRSLHLKSCDKCLSPIEKRLYESAKNAIISELAYVKSINLEEAKALIKEKLKV